MFFAFYLQKILYLSCCFSASVQPLTEEVEDKSQDFPSSGDSIRKRFLDFYASRGHKVLPSASLVPEDPTVLLTIAGMLQFKPIFLGKVICHYCVWSSVSSMSIMFS